MNTVDCPRCEGTGKIRDTQATGKEVRSLRENYNLSLRSIARRMGISPSYLSDLETGKRDWNDKRLRDYFLAIDGEMPKPILRKFAKALGV